MREIGILPAIILRRVAIKWQTGHTFIISKEKKIGRIEFG
jgi:hypothetical protein